MQYEILSVATDLHVGGMERFLDSAARAGLQVQILGVGQAWGGWRWRMQMYQDAAKASRADFLICCDAYDVIIHPQAARLIEALASNFSGDILVGAEDYCAGNCEPLDGWWAGRRKHQLQYANAGCIMGRREAMIDMYDWILRQEPHIQDDQIGVCKWMNAGHGELDTDRKLVTNVVGRTHFWGFQEPSSPFAHFPSPVTKYGLSLAYNWLSPRWSAYQAPPFFFGYDKKQILEIQGNLWRYIVYAFLLLLLLILVETVH